MRPPAFSVSVSFILITVVEHVLQQLDLKKEHDLKL